MNIHVKTAIILAITLILGFLLGALTISSLRRHAMHRFANIRETRGLIDLYTEEIGLTETQKDSIEKIFQSYHPRMMELAMKHRTMLVQLRDSLHAELAPFLTEEQLKRLNRPGTFGRGTPPFMRDPDFRRQGKRRGKRGLPGLGGPYPPGAEWPPDSVSPPPPPPE
jgi:hypothetical protein